MSRARGSKAPPAAWDPVPRGWRECPPLGLPVSGPFPGSGRLVPCKAPLSSRYDRVVGGERLRFTPEIAAEMVMSMVASQPGYSGGSLSLVLDLTNTTRYYDPAEFARLGIQHVKIPCRGRGRSPDPLAVNQACWEIKKALLNSPETYILVHCTHGFNRTGYVICAALCRLFAAEGIGVDRAVRRFAAARAPGIYKGGYISDLFWQHHERRPPHVVTPGVPVWKTGRAAVAASRGGGGAEEPRAAAAAAAGNKNGDSSSSDEDDEGGGKSGADSDDPDAHIPLSELGCGDAPNGAMHHDDVLGEAVPDEEAEHVRRLVFVAIVASRDFYSHGQPPSEAVFRQPVRFPGSQPVSLDRRNLELVQKRRYLVTWKADGTRYLLLATPWGAYLLDRAFVVRRVQVRFPTLHAPQPSSARPPAHPVGPPHVFTLMDGEMVVDEEEQQQSAGGAGAAATGAAAGSQQQQQPQQRRRYLAYDIMVLNTESVSDLRFADRIRLIEREVERPRALERAHFANSDALWRRAATAAAGAGKPVPPRPFYYAYEDEPFGFRRKDFWPLTAGEKVCRDFIPRLCHESDGLILQAADDAYVPYTCEALLKWKFAHLNSVDFVLRMVDGAGGGKREPQLLLKGRPRGGGRGGAVAGAAAAAAFGTAGATAPGGLTSVDGARVRFPEGERAETYEGRVVECAWDKKERCWFFLRERTDKGDPNAFTVFEKVVGSIEDDIREEDVLGAFESAVMDERGPYGEERLALEEQRRRRGTAAGGGGGGPPSRAAAAAVKAAPAPVAASAKAPAPPPRPPPPPAREDPIPKEAAASQPPPPDQPQAPARARPPPSSPAPPPPPPLAAFAPPRPPTLDELAALDLAAV